MAHQREVQAAAPLGLPDVRHFVDEEGLPPERLPREIVRPAAAIGMKPDVAGRRHRRIARLERPPFAADSRTLE